MQDEATLSGRTAVIAGAGRGIGRAIALAFARNGARLVLGARTAHEIAAVVAECRALGAEASADPVDVAEWAGVQAFATRAIGGTGRVDVLVNCAGIHGPIGPTDTIDVDSWVRGIAVNLNGAFFLCRAFLPHFREQRAGKIILLGGGGAAAPMPNFSSYAASKAGVARLADTLAAESAEYNVQVNLMAPGLVDTSLHDDLLKFGAAAGPLYEKVRLARAGGGGAVSPDVAASLAVFLASPASGTLTGKLIAAPYDSWGDWGGRAEELNASPLYTIRRIDPHTVGPWVRWLEE